MSLLGRVIREHLPGHWAGQDQIQRFGRGDQDVGRSADHLLALALRRVPGTHRDADLRAVIHRVGEGAIAEHERSLRYTAELLIDVAVPVTVAGMTVAPGDLIHAVTHPDNRASEAILQVLGPAPPRAPGVDRR